MKTLLLKMTVCGAALLPFSQVQAATYGGFAPGTKFTLTVKEKVSAALVGYATKPKTVPVPAGIPNFKVGQKVTFTIGAKGQLTAPGMSLPFKKEASTSTANVYFVPPSAASRTGDIGQVFKGTTGKAHDVALTFVRFKLNGFTPTTTTVVYTLK